MLIVEQEAMVQDTELVVVASWLSEQLGAVECQGDVDRTQGPWPEQDKILESKSL